MRIALQASIAAALAAGLCLAGCKGGGGRRAGPPAPTPVRRESVDAVNLQALPAAVNWDDRPGPDGLRTRVYLFQVERSEPLTANGSLDFLLYAGNVTRDDLPELEPVETWHYERDRVPRYAVRSLAGVGYAFSLEWGPQAPEADSVTLVARYTPHGGEPVESSPVAIAMKAR
jgi:hypothetical protein